jgi:hypothetical protein
MPTSHHTATNAAQSPRRLGHTALFQAMQAEATMITGDKNLSPHYTLAQAARIICGEFSGLGDPEWWNGLLDRAVPPSGT